jgi:hypothetical protein
MKKRGRRRAERFFAVEYFSETSRVETSMVGSKRSWSENILTSILLLGLIWRGIFLLLLHLLDTLDGYICKQVYRNIVWKCTTGMSIVMYDRSVGRYNNGDDDDMYMDGKS